MTDATQTRFSTREVSRMTGVTARQLQWWDECSIVTPKREGQRRAYSQADLSEILIIEQLRVRHVSLQRIRRVMRLLRREFGERLADAVTSGADHHLLLEGKNIYLETSDKQIVDLVKNARQPIFVVCLSDAVRRLQVGPDELVPGRKRAQSTERRPRSQRAS